jgi:hypothetical protein
VAQFHQGGVGVVADGLAEVPLGRGVEGRGVSAAVRPGLDRAGVATLAEELADPGEANGEAGCELFLGPFAGVVGRDDPLA